MDNIFVLSSARTGARLLALAVTAVLAACGSGASQQQGANMAVEQSEAARAAELDARAAELARREAEIAAKEQEQETARQQAAEAAQREQEEAARLAATREAAARDAAARRSAQARLAERRQAATALRSEAPPQPAPAPQPLQVHAGTQLAIALSSDLSSKTSKMGDTFDARLASDVVVDGRVAVPAGSRVTGTVSEVVSGSNAIGAVPVLAITLDRLTLDNGQQIPLRGELRQEGQSEKGRDTAKIVGGAAAGAVIGHQVRNDDRGKIIGGILGGAAGAVIAKKTGTEVQLPAGSQLSIALAEGFTVTPN